VGKQAALKLLPEAADHYERAWRVAGRLRAGPDWPDDTLAWGVRAALRADGGLGRWQQVVRGIDAMSSETQKDTTWVYWKARALQALAKDSQKGDGLWAQARQLLSSIAGQLGFYGALAAEDLELRLALPDPPPEISVAERQAALARPGLIRGLQLAALGLRDEGRREWNYSLRGMDDRQLLAAAALACEVHDWQLCINTSERTQSEIDLSQRYPIPYKDQIAERARELGMDPHYVQGLIRQETRFMATLRSHAGASGLMQVMPATARWTARRIGLQYTPDMIHDPSVNLRLGTGYLKMVLDAFEGSQALAAAAYNAGPSRPRRWREGSWLDAAAWAETIPFGETRDYVKKVLTNAAIYEALASGGPPALRARLGRRVGPRDALIPEAGADLP
jgi:soluble lytic murein transglycosylase